MTRISGRNIYITSLQKVLALTGSPTALALRSRESQFNSVWLRLSRGTAMDSNFTNAQLQEVRNELDNVDIEMWGWHVPFCADQAAARNEATNIVTWANQFSLAGVLVDAERTPESPRFRGGEAEA